jgi:hypothetical protein
MFFVTVFMTGEFQPEGEDEDSKPNQEWDHVGGKIGFDFIQGCSLGDSKMPGVLQGTVRKNVPILGWRCA